MNPPRLPTATYRLQLSPEFGFSDAAFTVPYLARLGVSHLYLSPIFEAVPGSTHGYDQTDPSRIRAELGGDAGFGQLVDAARLHSLSILLDFVPNHVAAHHRNPWWWSLLEFGRDSPYASHFDVAWDEAENKVVLPVLGAPLPRAIDDGELRVADDPALGRHLRYFDHAFPIAPGSDRGLDPDSPGYLHALVERQHYRPKFWREALPLVNYRRFFDISSLAGVRVEDPAVFEHLHAGLFTLINRGWVDAVRLDHIDGLLDPLAYLRRLRVHLDSIAGRDAIPILVEKILAPDERLPSEWPVAGATGYAFLAAAAALVLEPAGARLIRENARRLGAAPDDFRTLRTACKADAARKLLVPELRRLVRRTMEALDSAGMHCYAGAVERAIVGVSAALAVYRTYADGDGPRPRDIARIDAAVRDTTDPLSPATDRAALNAVAAALTLRPPFDHGEPRTLAIEFLLRWQQFTSPLAAKGVEDTALYRDASLLALNDVGIEPALPIDPAARALEIIRTHSGRHAGSLNATTTHDTKRGEDTRARIASLTHAPHVWISLLDRWLPAHQSLLSNLPSGAVPDPTMRLTLYKTIFALWDRASDISDLADRIADYAVKAGREAKSHTGWLAPDEAYESACTSFTRALLLDPAFQSFRRDLDILAGATRPHAALEALSIVLLKSLAPGVPDIYRGAEFRDLSLVDPDNRRPVDFARRAAALERLRARWITDPGATALPLLAHPDCDEAKLLVTWRALACRRWLLDARQPLQMESLEQRISDMGRISRTWTVTTGSRACTVVASLPPPNADDPARPRAPGSDDVNQLTGLDASDDPSPLVVTLHGVHEVIRD